MKKKTVIFLFASSLLMAVALNSCGSVVHLSDRQSTTTDEYLYNTEEHNGKWVNCTTCKGKGGCTKCNGTGQRSGRECSACGGTGKCSSCNGKGGYRR